MVKPDCHECKHKGIIPGDAHIRCNHPAFAALKNSSNGLFDMLASVGRLPPIHTYVEGIEVVGNPHGIKNGWFNHPFHFDPTWLMKCTGFEKVE